MWQYNKKLDDLNNSTKLITERLMDDSVYFYRFTLDTIANAMHHKKKPIYTIHVYIYIYTFLVGKQPKHKCLVTPYLLDVGVGSKSLKFSICVPKSRVVVITRARFSRPRTTLSTERVKFTVIKIITRARLKSYTRTRARKRYKRTLQSYLQCVRYYNNVRIISIAARVKVGRVY